MRLLFCILICFAQFAAPAEESWQSALSRMPLGTNIAQLNRSNCVRILLPALQSNDVVKALIFMPGATDEFYMFRRAKANLTNSSPTLLDAVIALTNQTLIQATFRRPFLLLHTDEDPLDSLMVIEDAKTAERIAGRSFVPHAVYNDRDWDFLLPILKRRLHARFLPALYSMDSFHFYRHSFAAWNLDGWEALQAIALAGKTRFTVGKGVVLFEPDTRVLAVPKVDRMPE
ncbi:MAG TPA: hypothetical protein VFB72_11755 [Verrucomicrobiae bacterium]|nr:hypothetical protein [Verrucomicrobiae bacterium]